MKKFLLIVKKKIKLKLEKYHQLKIKRDKNNKNITNNYLDFENFKYYDTLLKENKEDFSTINNLLEKVGNIYKMENTLFTDLIKESNSIHLQIQSYLNEVVEKNKFLDLCKSKII